MQDSQQFFSLNKPLDWNRGFLANVYMQENGFSIQRTDKYIVHRIIRAEELGEAEAIVDMAVGENGKLLLLDARANVWSYDYENRHRDALFREGHKLFNHKAMIASRSDLLYVAEGRGERRIAAYSLSNGQQMWSLESWQGVELHPLAICAAHDAQRSLYAVLPLEISIGLNGIPEVPENGRIGIMQWSGSGEMIRMYEHDALRLPENTPAAALRGRYYIASSSKGTIAVLDAKRNEVTVIRNDGTAISHFALAPDGSFSGISIDTNHNLYIGNSGVSQQGGERFILKYRATGELLDKVSSFRGRSDKLLHNGRDRMYVLDGEEARITLLDLESRTRILEESGLSEAVYFSAELDTTEPETVWHKIRLEANIPEETQIRISYFASDMEEGFVGSEYVNYTAYLTDPAIPLKEKLRDTQKMWSPPIVNPKDALLMEAKGQYMWLKIELMGSDRQSPFIRKLRVYFPRTSLISYLPPMYQQDAENSPFLERFLALFGTFFDDMEEKIAGISEYFDPDSTSGGYLQWLGRWLAISDRVEWGEAKLRLLIKQAPKLYKLRGTREGLIRMLQIYTGASPFILEYFQLKQMNETSELRQLFTQLYGDNPYCFCVMLRPEFVRTDKQRLVIEQIIEDQKPAYTEGKLIVLQKWMYADMHTYLGMNTYLSEPTLLTLDQQSSIPYNTVLIDVDLDNRMDIHTRLELDSKLE